MDEPHSAIDGPAQGEIVNLTDHRAETSRAAQLELLGELGPDRILAEYEALNGEQPKQALLPHLIMPAHHDVRSKDVFVRRLHGIAGCRGRARTCGLSRSFADAGRGRANRALTGHGS